ncbi:rhodanese-like domain-containing protein [Aestuariivirga sp.]|uniref:rhodanese-like domain-containing protein n=1 Tax=Aestuariivirga sp. TaxID=2650926 RepID=UPI00359332DC
MPLKHITAAEAKRLVDDGALLIDIRETNEYAAENIPGARNAPLSRLGAGATVGDAPVIVFHCKSGARTRMNAHALANCADAEAYILDGGIEAWKNAGLPVKRG